MTRMHRRVLLGGLGATLAAPGLLRAQPAWQPTRPIQLIVGFAPGGGSDIIARTVAEAATPLMPQPMVVTNRPGAGGVIAAEFVARAAPDGHTLLLAGGSESTSVPAHREVPYDPKRSFRSVIRLTRHPHFVCVRTRGRFESMQQVIQMARAEPGRLTHGSAGVGTLSHSMFMLLERRAGVEFLHVPYTGGGPVAQALLAGQIDLGVMASDEFGTLNAGGEIRAVAVASGERALSQPNVPTLKELGWDVQADNQKGWVGPAGMTDEMTSFLHDRFRQAMQAPVWQRFRDRLGEGDGYADGPGFQRDMDTLLDNVRAALRRA